MPTLKERQPTIRPEEKERSEAVPTDRSVLLVDDDRDFADTLGEILELRGYRAEIAYDAETALAKAANCKFGVALVDVRLGQQNGIGLLHSLSEERPKMLCVMMTAYATLETAVAALQEGAYAYLRKPLSHEDLFATLDRCFEKIRLEREKAAAEESLRNRNQELVDLNARLRQMVEAARRLTACESIGDLGKILLDEFSKNMAVEGGSLYLCADEGLELVHSIEGLHTPAVVPYPVREGSVFHRALTEKEPVFIEDISEERNLVGSGWEGYRNGSFLVFPLVDDRGVAMAILSIHNKKQPPFVTQDLELGQVLTSLSRETLRVLRVTEARQKSEKRFRELIENGSDIITVLDEEATILYESPSVERILGYSPEEMVGKSGYDFIHPEDREKLADAFKSGVRESRNPIPMEYRFRHKDGSWRVLESVGRNLLQDSAMQGIIANTRDVTERRRAEETLRESEDRFRSMVQNLSDVVWVVDGETRFKYETPSSFRVTGYEAGYLIGKVGFEFVHPEDLVGVQTAFREVVQRENRLIPTAFRFRHSNGHWLELEAVGSNMLDHPGIRGIVVTARDVTDKKRMEEERIELEKQLRQAQKMEAIGQLAGGVAHDFNNLLLAIQGYTDMALEDLPVESPTREDLKEVAKAVDRAAALVRQLLAFSRRGKLKQEYLDLSDTISELMKMLRRVIGENIELSVKTAPGLWRVYADRGQIEQVLMNLCVNARDAMAEGGEIAIATRNVYLDRAYSERRPWVEEGRYVRLSVSDSGIGIPPEYQERVFEPFFTTKEVGQGTGLGLATVYAVTKRHGGFVDLQSQPGRGTTFHIFLPAVVQAENGESHEEGPAPIVGGDETILLAEDEELVRNLATRILEKGGYKVLLARDGDEAVQMFDEHADEIDLCLLDVVMPKRSGKNVYEHIASRAPETAVLFSTGYSFRVFETGDPSGKEHDLIEKPYQMGALLAKVREILDRRKGR